MNLKKNIFVLIGAIACQYCFSQSGPQLDKIKEYAQKNMPRLYDSSLNYINIRPGGSLNYLFPLYQLFKQENKFRGIQTDNGYYDALSQAVSFMDDYNEALQYQVKKYDAVDDVSAKQLIKTIGDLKNIEHADAVKYISFAAKNANVIMINESHNKPLHRAFTLSLLEALYKKGFRYLAMETLNNFSSHSLNKLTAATGYFTNEPIGGELVRRALELGYTMVAYEDTSLSSHTASERDLIQARNIYRVIQNDPAAKILVHAGYGHTAKKSADKNYVPMAMAFKQISAIDPFCIDQVSMSDEGEFAYGQILYKAYTENFVIMQPSVAMLGGQAINVTNDDSYDLCVIHPPVRYKDGRPAWLSLGGLRQSVYVKPTVKETFLVQAYYESETKQYGPGQLVPADQSYIPSNKDNYLLYLRSGKYLIVFRDVAYRLIGKLTIEVN